MPQFRMDCSGLGARLLLAAMVTLVTLGAATLPAQAASVSATGGVITITYTSTDATAEDVTMNTVGTNWHFIGVTGAPVDIPIAGNCEIQVSAAGGTNQSLAFTPATTIDATACGSAPRFALDSTGVDHLVLSGVINMASGTGNYLIWTAPAQISADFSATLASGTIDFQSTITGSHALTLSAATVRMAGQVGGSFLPSSLSVTASSVTTLGANITTSGAQTYNGPVALSGSLTLTASPLTLGASNAEPITNGTGSAVTLTANVGGASSIPGVLGKTGGTTNQRNIALVKEGAGTLSLPAANTYTGATTVNAGTVVSTTSDGLGAASVGTTVSGGARLEFRAAVANVEPITLASGATLAASTTGVESLGGPITLQDGAQTLDAGTGAVLNLSGGVNGQSSGQSAVTATGAGIVSIGALGVGATHPIGSLTSSSSGGLRVGGDIHATGAVTLNGAVETRTTSVTVAGAPVSGSGTIDNGNGATPSTLTIDSGSEPNTLSGAIGSGAGDASKLSLILAGIGAHTLSAVTSGFIGSLTVQAGGLIVSGTLTHPSSTTIASGASVAGSGTGTIGSPVSLASGSSGFGIGAGYPYLLNVGALTSSTVTGYLNVVVDGTTPGTGYTQIASTGGATLTGLDVWSDGFEAPIGTVITPVTTATGITGTLAGHPEGSYYSYWRISYLANGGRDMTWTFEGEQPSPTAVSPSTSATAGGGTLTVTGPPLYDGTQVTVGGAACTNPTRISISELTCTLPAHAAGAVDVVVANGSRSATLPGAVTYVEPASPSTTTASSTTTRALAIGTPRLVNSKLVTTISTPGPGAIIQRAITRKGRKATTYCTVRRTVAASTDLTLTCALNARARAALLRSALRLTVTTSFTPTGGKATTRIAKVKAKRATTGKRALPL